MFYVLAAYYARGRFLSAVRQSAPSGTSHRGFETPGLRLLVTGSIHHTVKTASAAPRQRRKSKTVHAQRPDQIPPRAFYASPAVFPAHSHVIPAEAGTQRKTKHAIYHPVIPAQPAPYPDTGAGASAGGAPIQRGGANRHASSIWPCDNNIELCKGPIKGEGRWTAFRADFREHWREIGI